MTTEARYGSWSSPWTLERASTTGASFPQFWTGQIAVDIDGAVHALVRKGDEGGRGVVLRLDGTPGGVSLTPAPYDVRTSIYEYGGHGFLIQDGVLYFINGDQRWYRRGLDGEISPITAAGKVRYGAPLLDHRLGRIICVREDLRGEGEAVLTIVAIDPAGDAFGTVLVEGDDFYAWPVLSADSTRIAWVAWNHPHVPWDVTALRVGDFDADGRVVNVETLVAEVDEVACDPQFTPGGELVFCSDREGWWNYYAWRGGKAVNLCRMDLEFARPIWQMGTSDYRALDDRTLLGVYTEEGANRLGTVDMATGALTPLDLPYSYYARLQVHGGKAYALASSSERPAEVIEIDLASGTATTLLAAASAEGVQGAIAGAQHMHFPSAKGRTGYGFFYPPTNDVFRAPAGEKPPLLVFSHGGPTGCTNVCFNPGIQFWTSRGFAVFDVNYAGSTGYGREFRHLLKGGWGVVDVEDHVAAARYLADNGYVDPNRLGVRGWSAGGYNTFACLAFADTFHTGASYFGISDVGLFAAETHKFESRYADYLVGPAATSQDLWRERSPLRHADAITAPLVMFQGALDKITPPNQSELILDSLRRRNVPVMYQLFEGEGHGFRKAETNLACLSAELAFYGRIFNFIPADAVPEIALENADWLAS